MAETNDPIVTQQPLVTDQSNTKTITGMDALTLPTPDKVKAVFKVITFSIWVIALGANTFFAKDVNIKITILEITGFLTLILQKAEDFWGIKISSN